MEEEEEMEEMEVTAVGLVSIAGATLSYYPKPSD